MDVQQQQQQQLNTCQTLTRSFKEPGLRDHAHAKCLVLSSTNVPLQLIHHQSSGPKSQNSWRERWKQIFSESSEPSEKETREECEGSRFDLENICNRCFLLLLYDRKSAIGYEGYKAYTNMDTVLADAHHHRCALIKPCRQASEELKVHLRIKER